MYFETLRSLNGVKFRIKNFFFQIDARGMAFSGLTSQKKESPPTHVEGQLSILPNSTTTMTFFVAISIEKHSTIIVRPTGISCVKGIRRSDSLQCLNMMAYLLSLM